MEPRTWGPFTGRQLTVMIVTLIIGVAMLPGAVWAVDTFSNVAIQDPPTGVKTKVNSSHALGVGDWSGPLPVDGKTAPAAPAQSLNNANYVGVGRSVLLGPTTATLAIPRAAITNNTVNWNYANTSFFM